MMFSITIPAYKTRFLRECIDSVLAQTYTDFEVIILNDASPEDVDGIVHSFTDNRIRYYKNEENVGAVNLVDNWNKCLELARGDYIICMGDDDKLMPDCLEQYVRMIQKYPKVDLFHARTLRIDEQGSPLSVSGSYVEYEQIYSFMLHRLNFGIQFIGDFCYRTDKLKQMGGYYWLPLAWGSDYITSYLVASKHGIVHISNILFCYRSNSSTISSTGNVEVKLQALLKEMKWYEDFLRQEPNGDLIESMCHRELKERYLTYFKKSKARIVGSELKRSKLRLFHWIRSRKTFGLTMMELALSLYYSRRLS